MFVDIFMALVHSEDDIPLLLVIQELFFGSSLGRQHSLKCAMGTRCRPLRTVVQQGEIESIPASSYESTILGVQFKVCQYSLYAVMWLVDEPREFNLPTYPQRCITYVPEKLPSKYGVHSEEYLPIRTKMIEILFSAIRISCKTIIISIPFLAKMITVIASLDLVHNDPRKRSNSDQSSFNPIADAQLAHAHKMLFRCFFTPGSEDGVKKHRNSCKPHMVTQLTRSINANLKQTSHKLTAAVASSEVNSTKYSVFQKYVAFSIEERAYIIEVYFHTDYLNTHNILDPYQSGFRTGHSTSTALLKVTEDIREALDKGQITILTLLDYSKAFDTVDVDLLIAKLRVLHFSDNALAWMDSYLRERQQCVSINNRYSTWRTTKTGVPQGSVLGPLLFSIYINDISSNLTSCRHHIYADDIQIYLHTRPNYINDAITKVNDDLNSISIWSKTHGLNLNASKSQAILIEHQRSKCDKQNLPPIIVNNTTIPYSTTVKNLGIYMDCHLEWNEQVNHTSKKIFSIIHSLKRLKNFLPDKLKLILVQTLVMPHFDYCDIILSNLNANLSNRLQRVHNACVRYICNIRSTLKKKSPGRNSIALRLSEATVSRLSRFLRYRNYVTCLVPSCSVMSGTEKNSLRHRDLNPGFQLYVLTFYPLNHNGFPPRCRIESSQFKLHFLGFL
ncbi:hypothetical protein ANN_16314 [Periplaneta americana]|uniref:Reverse transcriptase domain-containing protein n=1 Tax=Periplaneta americana TaxID=6978 RepID=A0ABQ8SKK8_PERAM|nr:hypothetical protein ANN_16314 [Periplaneta americana]